MFHEFNKDHYVNLDNIFSIEIHSNNILEFTLTSGKKLFFETKAEAKTEMLNLMGKVDRNGDVINY
ncbi:MAG: hypothetical protein LBK29_00215 [Oscillospiraceae bacterium]|jgi:hypothetical protein|nr:hypothetical protein [Oscillospiraceae bacterium]